MGVLGWSLVITGGVVLLGAAGLVLLWLWVIGHVQ